MRAVVDTNVLVSALIRPQGRVGPLLRHLREGTYTLLYTQPLLEELADVLNRPRIRDRYGLDKEGIKTVLALILLRGEAVASERAIIACRDPRNDQFLKAAVAGRADAIVSGDEGLLALNPFEDIRVVSPAAFLQMLDVEKRGGDL